MKITRTLLGLILPAGLAACSFAVSSAPATPTPGFATATLPATQTLFPTQTATPAASATPAAAITVPANCTTVAILVKDVTIPDGTAVTAGSKFTKTWQLQNAGTCPWVGFTVVFDSGDRMGAPEKVAVADTAPKATVDVSVDLTAPSADGSYTGNFALHDSAGKAVGIGTYTTFWVQITVGSVATPGATGTGSGSPTATPPSSAVLLTPQGSCHYTINNLYGKQVINLINGERQKAGIPALTVNSLIASAAQNHSIDMACHGTPSHTGSDGSTIHQRLAAAGYNASFSEEIIHPGYGATPDDALRAWMADPAHRDAVLDPRVTEAGAGFAFVATDVYGCYFTVDLARP